eukprot:3295413-Amphidinium_carterae.2
MNIGTDPQTNVKQHMKCVCNQFVATVPSVAVDASYTSPRFWVSLVRTAQNTEVFFKHTILIEPH